MRLKFVAFALAAVVTAAMSSVASAQAVSQTLTGVWKGEVAQTGRAGSYHVVLTVTAKGATTSYPDTPCSGDLKRIGASPNFVFYAEEITEGRFDAVRGAGCLDGTITVHRDGDKLFFSWFGVDKQDWASALATLTREPAAPAAVTKSPPPAGTGKAAPAKAKTTNPAATQ